MLAVGGALSGWRGWYTAMEESLRQIIRRTDTAGTFEAQEHLMPSGNTPEVHPNACCSSVSGFHVIPS